MSAFSRLLEAGGFRPSGPLYGNANYALVSSLACRRKRADPKLMYVKPHGDRRLGSITVKYGNNSSAQDSPRQNVSNAMKICVFGAGAIGGYLAVELSLAGHDVCVIARGEHLSAIASKGLTLRMAGIQKTAIVCASDDPSRFGPQDYVFCTLKSHQAYTAAPSMLPLLGPDTAVVTAMNGIPWWYFYKEGSSFEGTHLSSVDPKGLQWETIGPVVPENPIQADSRNEAESAHHST